MNDLCLNAAHEIWQRRDVLADAVAARRRGGIDPALLADQLSYLADALAVEIPELFSEYVAWAKVVLAGRGVPEEELATDLAILVDVLREELPRGLGELAGQYIEPALGVLPRFPCDLPTVLTDSAPLADLARRYFRALLDGARRAASAMILRAVEAGTRLRDVYLHVFQRSQQEIGRLWQMNQLSVAQEHFCTAATQLVMSQLYPLLFAAERNGRTLVATCVAGDLHEIGVRMVSDFFEMDGWDTCYLGADTPTESVVRTLRERQADMLAISVTMTFHLRAVTDLIGAVRASSACRRVKILVGGHPFNAFPDLPRRIGADATAVSAEESLAVAARLMA